MNPSRIVEVHKGTILPSLDANSAAVSAFGIDPYLLDVHSGAMKAPLELPAGFRGSCDAYSYDGAKLAGVFRNKEGEDFILVWNASNGKLLQRVLLPGSAGYVMSLRFSQSSDVIYAGARKQLFEYTLQSNQIAALIPEVPYYVLDIAANPNKQLVAYVEGLNSFGLHEWSRSNRVDLPTRFQPEIDQSRRRGVIVQCRCVDYSIEGSEIAAAVAMRDHHKVFRFNTLTGRQITAVIVPIEIEKIRYINDTKVLFVWGRPSGKRSGSFGGFGFIKPDSTKIDDWHEVRSWVKGGVVDPGENGHVSVGLTNGTLLQWYRRDWPQNWVSLLRK